MNNVQPMVLPDGVYFNLSNDQYHADPALSHSGMTKVLVSWQDYWVESYHNNSRPKYEPTDAVRLGERTGMRLLEPAKFKEKYKSYGRSKPNEKGVWLSSIEDKKIEQAVSDIMNVPKAAAYFEHGYAEVSIIWTDKTTGVRLRVRIDYLRTFGAIDYKRIKGVGPFTIGSAVKAQGLDIQNFLYLEGIKAARQWLRRMTRVQFEDFAKREGVDIEWLTAFMMEEDLLFRFLFQRSTSPYVWKIRELDSDVLIEGANATFEAMKRYKDGLSRFGTGAPDMGDGELGTISKFHVPRREYDYE